MEKKYLDLKKKPANRKHQNRGKGGRVVIMVVNTGTTSLPDLLEAGVDHVITINQNGAVLVQCQKWTRDDSDAVPVKSPDGPLTPLVITDAVAQQIMSAIDALVNPLIIAQFGPQPVIAPANAGTAAIPPAATIQLGVPVSDSNTTAPGANYPLTIAGGTGTNTVVLQYSADGGKTWNNFGTGSNVADGTEPLDVPNPTGVSGSTQIQAVLTVGGVNFTSNVITINF